VLDFITEFVERNEYSPSYEEIAEGMKLASLATVHKHISALEAKHYIRRSFNRSRSLEVTSKFRDEMRRLRREAPTELEMPLVGRIAAGAPVEAVAGRETLNFSDFAGREDMYALEVRGDSMIEDHILSGDYVLVDRAGEARDGDIVVALVRGAETTLKRFYREPGDKARLQPANPAMAAIIIPISELQIQGRVLAVLRKYK